MKNNSSRNNVLAFHKIVDLGKKMEHGPLYKEQQKRRSYTFLGVLRITFSLAMKHL